MNGKIRKLLSKSLPAVVKMLRFITVVSIVTTLFYKLCVNVNYYTFFATPISCSDKHTELMFSVDINHMMLISIT